MKRIGVTGHRFLSEIEKIHAGVEEVLGRIETKFSGEPLTIISALAEGADRIVARYVLERPGSRLMVPLPLPASEYLNDFKSNESREEFLRLLERADSVQEMPETPTREQAYEAAGDFVLDNSDVLIAIWDGKHAQGRGGTGDIVSRARKRGIPVAWIHAGNREAGTDHPTTLGAEQGRVTFESF